MKPFSIILILLVTAVLSSCHKSSGGDPHPRNYYTSIPDTNRYAAPITSSATNGYIYSYYPYSNTVSSEGNYEHGVPSGYWKTYYPSGRLLREGNYAHGKLSGYWKFYYQNGLIQEEGNYQNNVKSGNWIYYHNNGQVASEGNYANGAQQGEWRYYNMDGSLNHQTTY